jgi:hypothetical protein
MSEPSNIEVQRLLEAHAAEVGAEPAFPRLELRSLVALIGRTARVEARSVLIGRTRYERMWVVINRAVRGVVRHAVEPVVGQQNAWNAQLARTLDDFAAADHALDGEVVRLRAEAARRAE